MFCELPGGIIFELAHRGVAPTPLQLTPWNLCQNATLQQSRQLFLACHVSFNYNQEFELKGAPRHTRIGAKNNRTATLSPGKGEAPEVVEQPT